MGKIVFFLFSIALFIAFSANVTPAQQVGSISGNVTIDPTGEPIPYGWLKVVDADWKFAGTGCLNEDGSYTITDLSPGSYYVGVGAPQYMPEVYNNTPAFPWPPSGATLVTVSEGEDTPNINFSLEKGGSISGKITAEATDGPISDVKMPVFDSNWNWIGVTKTDENGQYTTTGLVTGDYYIRTKNNQGYVDEVYDNIPCLGVWPPEGAKIIHVEKGVDTPNINFALEPGGSISGKVVDQDSNETIDDASSGGIDLSVGWHKLIYRHQEYEGGELSSAAFKGPGDKEWKPSLAQAGGQYSLENVTPADIINAIPDGWLGKIVKNARAEIILIDDVDTVNNGPQFDLYPGGDNIPA